MATRGRGRIIGGLGSPHAPSIGAAFDREQHLSAEWKPLFDGYAPMASWLAEKKPDLMIMIYNDHANTFFFDKYPTFAISVAAEHEIADEGWGKRPLAPIPGQPEVAWQLAHSLVDQEFDMTVCQEMPLDHGCLTPMSCFFPPERRWAVPMIPICVNVLQPPIPTAMRCFKLGQAIRRAIEAYPKDLRVVIAGTGGLTHQLGGERYGHTNPDWDREILDLVERDPAKLAAMTHQELMERGGSEGVEIIMWLVMRGALSPNIRCIHRNYYLPMVTGFAQVIYEEFGRRRRNDEGRVKHAMAKTPLILLPGLLCNETVWPAQEAGLADLASSQVIDFGSIDSLPSMASHVLAQAPSRFALAGHSMGGRVAFEVMRQAPERVIALGLFDTAFHPLPAGEAGETEKTQRHLLLALARARGMRAAGWQWLQNMIHELRLGDEALVDAILTMIEAKTPDQFAAQITALLNRPDAEPLLPSIRCPTLVLCGREDRFSLLAYHERMAEQIPASRLVVIETCGHMSTMERPAAVTAAMRDWLTDAIP